MCNELEGRHKEQRDSLYKFLLHYHEVEKKKPLVPNRHIEQICNKLEDVFYGRIKRLIINVPPRSLKTQAVSIAFPAWSLGKRNDIKFMEVSYSATLAEQNSWEARNMYNSDTYTKIFPRKAKLRSDRDTRWHWETETGWQYYASGSTGAITGLGCDILLIDDPLKPWDANSNVVRVWVNNNYHETLESRLNDKTTGAIVIIMQRLHDDDLCGHLLELEAQGLWEKREKLIIPAIANEDETFRKQWESFFETRFPKEILQQMKAKDPVTFSTQYQQEPVNKETQEFHEERYKYHWWENNKTPTWLRIFTTVDPAFKTWQENDETAIITWWFKGAELYILEVTAWRYTPDVLQDKIIYHIKKRSPEKVGIEAYQAQSMIWTYLKQYLTKIWIYTSVEEIRQTGDKNTKIRKLVPLYREWLIYHKLGMDVLEYQLQRFPRWKHDDIIDCLQMLYSLYELQPNQQAYKHNITIEYDYYWNPIYK